MLYRFHFIAQPILESFWADGDEKIQESSSQISYSTPSVWLKKIILDCNEARNYLDELSLDYLTRCEQMTPRQNFTEYAN